MASQKTVTNLSPEQENLNSRIFNLIIGRVFKKVYLDFNENQREDIKKILLLGNNKETEKFIKKNIPSFKKVFEEESKKIEQEFKEEIEKQF